MTPSYSVLHGCMAAYQYSDVFYRFSLESREPRFVEIFSLLGSL